jgi:hypothetical protein
VSGVRQCPLCVLRFPNEAELKDHLETDHPGAIENPDDPS